ncbi:hypothetical protein E1J26_20585 [Xanthomonas hortorum pv. vitians]|nr:hypothetical protein [Xanthomonas hortorum pv. vitians]
MLKKRLIWHEESRCIRANNRDRVSWRSVLLAAITRSSPCPAIGHSVGHALHASYAAMAIANGVPEEQPALAPCRVGIVDDDDVIRTAYRHR